VARKSACYAVRVKIRSELSISCAQSNADNPVATLEVNERFRDFGFPVYIRGWFLDLTFERLLSLTSTRDGRVGFRGSRYQFAGIEADGSFILRRYATR
jgi:hypothetical protein